MNFLNFFIDAERIAHLFSYMFGGEHVLVPHEGLEEIRINLGFDAAFEHSPRVWWATELPAIGLCGSVECRIGMEATMGGFFHLLTNVRFAQLPHVREDPAEQAAQKVYAAQNSGSRADVLSTAEEAEGNGLRAVFHFFAPQGVVNSPIRPSPVPPDVSSWAAGRRRRAARLCPVRDRHPQRVFPDRAASAAACTVPRWQGDLGWPRCWYL